MRKTLADLIRFHWEIFSYKDFKTHSIQKEIENYYKDYVKCNLNSSDKLILKILEIDSIYKEYFSYSSYAIFYQVFYAGICNLLFKDGYISKSYSGVINKKKKEIIEYSPMPEKFTEIDDLLGFASELFECEIQDLILKVAYERYHHFFENDNFYIRIKESGLDLKIIYNSKFYNLIYDEFLRILYSIIIVNLFENDIYVNNISLILIYPIYTEFECFID